MPDPEARIAARRIDVNMHPSWARIFEPPSVTGGQWRGIILTLLVLYGETGGKKYLDRFLEQ